MSDADWTCELYDCLLTAKDNNLIIPTMKENLAVKKSVNMANRILAYANNVPGFGLRDLAYRFNIREDTARRYLITLSELGFLNKQKHGREYTYSYRSIVSE